MWKKIQPRVFPFIIALSALSVSASAAFYSVSGLSKLFAGASLQVIIMAGSLEVAKLVIASLLYQYWDKLNKALRTYLTIAAGVLILITSMGIYGFLSAAYQETANKAGNIDAQIALVEVKRDNVKEQLDVYTTEKETINKSVTDLRAGLSNNIIQYTNAEGQLITTTSSATRKSLEAQLDQAITRQNTINSKVDELNTQLFEYETEIVEIKTENDLAGELGPLKYLSGLTGMPMDKIINILLLVIIFVFDPLAISLVVAANFAFAQLRPKKDNTLYPEPQVEPDSSNIKHKVEVKDLPEEVIDEILKGEEFEVKPSVGTPIMVDPKTGRLFYIEDTQPSPTETNQLELEFPPHSETLNFDLDGDGVIEDEEIETIFNRIDTNDDGIIDENEAKKFNLSLPIVRKLNEVRTQEKIVNKLKSDYESVRHQGDFFYLQKQIKEADIRLKDLRSELDSLIRNEDTKRYF